MQTVPQALAADANGREAQASRNADRSAEVLQNALLASLKADLARQEAKLEELGSHFGDAHPQVLDTRASIKSLREKVAQETARINGAYAVSAGVMNGRLAQAQSELTKQREKLLRLKEQRNGASVWFRDVENLQRAYDAVQVRLNQSTIESQTRQTNLSVLKYATDSIRPSSPRTLLNLAVALFLGIVIGSITAVAIELMDRRVRTHADIVRVLELPIVGVMLKSDNLQTGLLRRRNPLWTISHSAPRTAA